MCIFAAVPASGQVNDEGVSVTTEQSRADGKRAQETTDPVVRTGQEVRLVASEPRLNDVPRVSLPVNADNAERLATTARDGASAPAARKPGPHRHEAAPPSRQPAALAAAPIAPPPVRPVVGSGRVTAPGIATLPGALQGSWQQALLVGVIAIGSIWLFWWLGQRSRQVEPAMPIRKHDMELALTEAMIAEEEAYAARLPTQLPFEEDDSALVRADHGPTPLPTPAGNAPADLFEPPARVTGDDDGVLLLDGSDAPRFETFHEAMAAMKAEMARSFQARVRVIA